MRSKQAVTADTRDVTTQLLGDLKGVKGNAKPKPAVTDPFKVPQGSKPSIDHPQGLVRPNAKSRKGMEAPVTTYVRSLGGDYKTTQEVAALLGVSPQLVRKWSKDSDIKAPSKYAPFGRLNVYLYTKEDVKELTAMMAKRRVMDTSTLPSRKKKA